jgi:aspartate racemase
MSKRIGILGGISYESTKDYYELFHRKYYEQKNDFYFPEIVVYSLNFQKFTDLENTNQEKYIEYILQGIKGLEAAQADFIIMAANSPHSVYKQLVRQAKVPIYSIADATIARILEKELRRVLLLGIKHTMDSDFYPAAGKVSKIDVVVPVEDDKQTINDIIFSELCVGVVNNTSKEKLLRTISHYDVNGVILGCTELPQIIKKHDLKIEVFNTLEIHVEDALEKCMK